MTLIIEPTFDNHPGVPAHLRHGLIRYVQEYREPGGFLMAVLSNNLAEAFGRADEGSRDGMYDLVCWLYNEAPSSCWGSPEKVATWLTKAVPQ